MRVQQTILGIACLLIISERVIAQCAWPEITQFDVSTPDAKEQAR
ncbi:MAG TPA: hypothetical protein VEK79_16880 [Thermoanaerobaculia bacterium]|nr:hypothetical protein [Thermoanaerobaculia bacterium]